jgi:hypothetical protein
LVPDHKTQEGAGSWLSNPDDGAKRRTWKRTPRLTCCPTICVDGIRRKPRRIPWHQMLKLRKKRMLSGARIDGGNEQHPIHDEDQEDAGPDDYEREIDRLDQAIRGSR